MALHHEKIEKLVRIAKLYYYDDKKQGDIAREMGISRPLISRYLSEAREKGIVKIQIESPVEERRMIVEKFVKRFGIAGGYVVDNMNSPAETDTEVADAVIEGIKDMRGMSVGLGWGTIMGRIISRMEGCPAMHLGTKVYPLIGDSGTSGRDFRTGEMVRDFADRTGGTSFSWYSPAFVDNTEDMKYLKELSNYRQMVSGWRSVRIAFVSIENYPSVPDFATAASYGSRLMEKKAAGKILSYYYDTYGNVITPEVNCVMQVPADLLSKARAVVGICGTHVTPGALAGALNTGVVTHVVAPRDTAIEALKIQDEIQI